MRLSPLDRRMFCAQGFLFSGEFETLKEVLVQGLPNILNFGDSITILLKENGLFS